MSDCYGSLHLVATDNSFGARNSRGDLGGKKEKTDIHGSSVRSMASRHASTTSTPYLSRVDEKKKQVRTNISPDAPVRDDDMRSPSPGSTVDTRTTGTASKDCIPTPRTSRPSGSGSTHSLHASHVHVCTHTGSEKGKSHSEGTSNRPIGHDDGWDGRSVASRPTASCDCSQCAAPRSEKRAYCETVVSRPSQECFEEESRCGGCWAGCDECWQPQPWPKRSCSPPPGWGCERGSDCGECDFCRACAGPTSVQDAVYKEEVLDDDLKGPGYPLAAHGAPSVGWGWGGRGDECLQHLEKSSARDVRRPKTSSEGSFQRMQKQSANTGENVDVHVHVLEQDRNDRKTRGGHAAMNSRTNNQDNICQTHLEDYLRHFENKISTRLDRLERNAGATPLAARNDQGMSTTDLELRDLSKQVLKMSVQQKVQREHSVLDRLMKIEEKLTSKDSTSTTHLAAQSHAQAPLELRELLRQQKWELHDLRKEVRRLSELRDEVVDLSEEVVWMRERINALENLACQRERTGQADISGPAGSFSRGRDESIGHAGLGPPGHSGRAQEGVADVFDQGAGGEWRGEHIPSGWNPATSPLASPMSQNGWHQVTQTAYPSEFSFRQHSRNQWGQRLDAGWGSPVFSHGDLDGTNTPLPPNGMFWSKPTQSRGNPTKSPSVSSVDFFNRAHRATYHEVPWGSPGEPSRETVSMHSPSRGRCLWSQNRWNESPVGLNDLDAASPSTPRTRRCPTVETISDTDLVSGPSSPGRDWNRITSHRVAGNEIVPTTRASRRAPRALQSQRSDDSWDDLSTVNHPPRPTASSKAKKSTNRSSRSDRSGLERGPFGYRKGAPPTSWDETGGKGWSGDRAGRVYGSRGGNAGGWGGGGDTWDDHKEAVGDSAASACGWD